MNTPTYSIIIPHFEIPDLLRRCLESIPERDDVQIIVVDDNSRNGDHYLELYPFLRRKGLEYYPTHEGRGAGYARNVGIEHARGKWLLFADADDFFTYCFGDMLDKYKDCGADMVCFGSNSCDSTYYTPAIRCPGHNRAIALAETNYNEALFQLKYCSAVPWSRLVKRELVNSHEIHFDETPHHDDVTFSYLVGHHAKAIAMEQRAIYTHTIRQGSIMHSYMSEDKRLAGVDVYSRREKFMNRNVLQTGNTGPHYYELLSMMSQKEWSTLEKAKEILRCNGFTDKEIRRGIIRCRVHILLRKIRHVITVCLVKAHIIEEGR